MGEAQASGHCWVAVLRGSTGVGEDLVDML
jgi:hypothetical protein